MNGFLRIVVTASCILWGGAPALSQQSDALAALRAEAVQALSDGDPAKSAAIAEAVLKRTGDDYQTLYILSLARTELGQDVAAVRAAQQAYKSAATDNDRLQAARVVAAAKFRQGQYTRAEWWLRRGANNVTNAQDAQILAQEFGAIRQKNPLSLRFGFWVAPSDNINGGAENAVFSLGQFQFIFNPSSLALSGVEYSGDVELSYRLSQGPDHITHAGLYLFGRTYSLSSGSQARAPNVSGSDFALGLVDVSLTHRRSIFAGVGPTGVSVNAGQVWYGGDPVWRYHRVSLSQSFAIGQAASVVLQAGIEDQTGLVASQPDAEVYDVEARYARSLGNRDVVRLTLRSRYHNATVATNTYRDHSATLGYEFAKPVLGSQLSLSLGVGRKSYHEFSLSLDGRRDRYASLGATVVFPQVSYLGFSPSWSMTATRTKSNVARFETRQVTGRLGLQSQF